jgi:hypothetical protein
MDEIINLRVQVEDSLYKLNELEIVVNDITREQCKNSRGVIKCRQTFDKKPDEYDETLNLNTSGRQEQKRTFNTGEPIVQPSRDGYMIVILESIAKSLKVHVYLLAAITLIFVICKISDL